MKQISISIGDHYLDRIKAMAEKKEISRSEVMRRAIDALWKKEMGDEPRTPAPSKLAKAAREEAYERLLAMDDDGMTAELNRIGAIEAEWKNEDNGSYGTVRIGPNYEGVRSLLFTTNGKPAGFDKIEPTLNNVKNNLKKYYPHG